jgi:hypothetical protein
MAFVSARFVKLTAPDGTVSFDRHVKAIDDRGREWQHSIDCEEGEWLRYLEAGGKVDPYDESEHTDNDAGDAAASGSADDAGSN